MSKQSAGHLIRIPFAGVDAASQTFSEPQLSGLEPASRRSVAKLRLLVALAAVVLLVGAHPASAQTPTLAPNWTQLTPETNPGTRSNNGIAFDSTHGQTVLFGGFTSGGLGSDTWLWNGTNWTNPNVSGPSARGAFAIAYDSAHGQVVLFGGIDGSNTRLSDTWLWNGTSWTAGNSGPPARAGAAMAYDAAHDRVVMFGGVNASGTIINDTWLWDGTNWTQASVSAPPLGRQLQSMSYDPVHGQVVMFGGFDANGQNDNQTWLWNGTTWTQASPSLSPSGRQLQGMAYDASQGVTVLFGGYDGTNYLNDTWAWNGTTWTTLAPFAVPSARGVQGAMAYDSARSQIVLYGGDDFGTDNAETWTFEPPQNFGSINLCPSGGFGQAPCSNTLTLTYTNIPGATYFNTPQVVTEGSTTGDFTLGSGSTCVSGAPPSSCTVVVTFTPQYAGLRVGAVKLLANGNQVLATTPIYGIGVASQLVYGPAISGATILNGPSLENAVSTTGFTPNPRGMVTDYAGDLYIADPSNERLLMRASNGTTTTVGTLGTPQDVAIDGAGDLFVADTGLRGVVEIPAGCTTGTCQVLAYQGASADPVAVVVDGLGDLFVADSSAGGVVEVPAGCTSSACYVPIGSNWHSVNALALDAAGDLFVTDSSAGSVSKFPAGCTTNSCRASVGPGWIVPQGIAVDAAGDLYVSDTAAAGGMGAVFEVPAGCSSSSCEIQLVTGIFAYDLAVDQLGQVYAADGQRNHVLQINQSAAPTESFASTIVGSTSSDSPQTVTILDVGNQPLQDFYLAVSSPFVQTDLNLTTPDCVSSFVLQPGQGCNLGISFEPTQAEVYGVTATLEDNTLNLPATQNIILYGTGTGSGAPLTLSGQGSGTVVSIPPGINCTLVAGIGQGTCTANFPDDSLVSLQETPGSGYAFQAWGGGCTGSNLAPTCSFTITGGTSLTASFTPGYLVTVTEVGTGTGTVSSSSAGIACALSGGVDSGTCSGSVPTGTQLSFGAVPSGNSIFAGWGGDCASSGNNLICVAQANAALNVTATYIATGAQSGSLKPITAGVVYGQGGSFTSTNGNAGAGGLNNPTGIATDPNGNLYVADRSNNRVLFYPAGSTTATRVYGQNGSFTSTTANLGGVSANSLNQPWTVATDASGNLYIADGGNNRVLFYLNGSTTATRVYGQGGSFTSNGPTLGGVVSADSLQGPGGLAVDSNGNLYVETSYRVLFYPAASTTATRVYGQNGLFNSQVSNLGGITANSLGGPAGVALDPSGDLYIADQLNHRVLFYPNGSTTATAVYGQGGSFTSNTPNNGGISANSLYQPSGVTTDATGNLYVSEYLNNRVLFFPAGSTTATRVYGQGGGFATGTANYPSGTISANSLLQPTGVALDAKGDVFVADIFNNRVVEYGPFGKVNVCPSGQSTPAPCSNTYAMSYYAASTANIGSVSVVTQGAVGLDFAQANGGNCSGQISAGNTCTLDVSFTPLAPGSRMGAVQILDGGGDVLATQPIYGVGQAPVIAISPGTQTVLPLTGLQSPSKLALDAAGNLYISDYSANQVYKYAGGVQTTVPTSGLNSPSGVAVDGTGNLFIADSGNHRVVEIPAGCTTAACQVTAPVSGLQNPSGMAVDGAGDLFISDFGTDSVVKLTPSGVQTTAVSGLGGPFGVAVDAMGDIFIADTYNNQALEVTAGGVRTILPTVGITSPENIWVDAAGDVFVVDWIGNGDIVELPAGGGAQFSVFTGTAPEAVLTDGAGNIFIANTFAGQVVEISQSFLTLNLGVVNQGYQSVDTPVSMQNVGNQTLTGSMGAVLGANFFKDQINSTCGTFSLAPGAICYQNFYATATTVGPISANAIVNDNSLNNSSANQTITLSALSIGPTVTITATGSGTGSGVVTQNPTGINCGFVAGSPTSGPCTSSISTGLTVTFEEIPTSGSTFTGWGGACANYASSQFCTVLVTAATNVTASFAAAVTTTAVPNVVALTQPVASGDITSAGFAVGTVTSAFSSAVPSGSVVSQNPAAGAQASPGATVDLVISEGEPPAPNQLALNNNYFVTGDYVSAGVTLRGTGVGGMATGNITIPSSSLGGNQGVPNGADILAAYLYWESVENTPSPSGATGTFNGYSITGQQIGSDQPYTDGALSGTLRVYRANVNTYIPVVANGIRMASGAYTVSLPDGGGAALPLTEGASMVVIYRVLSPNFPLKSIVIYDGSAIPTAATGALSQTVQGFYDAVGGANGTGELTNLFAGSGTWNGSSSSVTLGAPDQFSETLNPGNAYAAVILSTPVKNSDNDGILDAWKAGPGGGDAHAGQPGYYDVKTQAWVALPGALHGEKDLFVQLDYMCAALLADGSCDFTQENLYPSPDASGNDPLAMVQQAFAADGVVLHLNIGNAVPESTCTDSPGQLCEFPNQPGVVSWDNSVQISKVWPRNFTSCAGGGDCTPRFQYGQKDSYHYVLFGFSLAIPAWNTRYGTLTSIQVAKNVATITTADRGTGLYACPSRVTISGVLGNPNLNGVYNTTSCASSTSITLATSNVPDWSYPNNTLPEPVIGLTPGLVSSISGYSDLGGSDSAVTLGLWETAPNQDMSKAANVIAGTLFHEIGHTLGLTHGGLYYDGAPNSYIPTFEANCKPNFQSSMNYLFQLDGVGPNMAVAYSNQTLSTITEASVGSTTQLTDQFGNAATFATSSWYVPYVAGTSTASPATLHCDGTPIGNDTPAYRVSGPVAPIAPAWSSGQNITYDGQAYTTLRGYNETANMDLRQVGATGGEFAALASVLSFGASAEPLNIAAGGSATLGTGGTVTLGSGGIVTLGSGGNVTLGSGGTITLGSGGTVTLGSGGNVTLGSGGTVTPGSSGIVALGSGGTATLNALGTITLGSGGIVTLGSGGIVTLGSGGATVNGVTEPAGPISVASGGIIALGSGGSVTLSEGGVVTLGSGGIIAMGSGGTVTLGSGGIVTLGSGGIIALGSGGNVTLGSGGNVTLGSGGIVALGSGGTITLGSGGIVTLGSGGSVTLGGDLSSGSGGNITLGSGGTVALGSGGTVTLGSGGIVALGSGGLVTLGSGGIIAFGSGGIVTLGSGGIVTLGSGGATVNGVPEPAGPISVASGGIIALGSGGTVALGSGGIVTLGSGGIITMGSGGTITLGSGGIVTMGSGGVVTLGSGGTIALGSGGNVTLGSGGIVALGSGGATTNELTYETANSVVRPPSSPTDTPIMTGGTVTSVRVDWKAPAFGVVQTYAVYRSSNGATPILIGSVSGVNGFAPATTFTDTNPDLTSQTVVYTISTILAPVPIDPTSRQSASVPAVLTNDQTIVLGALPSSVTISTSSLTVTATAMTSGLPNGQQVNFTASPAATCSITSQSIAGGVSSATITLNATGSCTLTASQPGSSASQLETGSAPFYNAANSVSGTFAILAQNSSTSQTITFPPLSSVQYGNTFTLSGISASSGLPITFTASGNCTLTGATSGSVSGVGMCTITAKQAGNSTYSAASESQSFPITPAVLKVTATNFTIAYGQAIPTLTSTYSGFVNNESSSVISGAPALSTTATASSNPGSYLITVSTGTLAAANYSFLYVNGTLTIGKATATINVTPYSLTYNGNPHTASGAATGIGGVSLPGLVLSATTHTAAGTYADTWTFTDTTGTYNNASGTVTDKILPASLVITAGSASMIYGGPPPPITPSYMGFVNSENASKLTTQPICMTSATSTSPVGAYVSTCSSASDPNYSISYVAGTVQVKQASSTIAVTSSSTSNTSTFGQSVTFTATVTPQYSGTTPTGTVTFYNNGSQIGTGTLSAGQAAFSTASLPASAADSITGVYSGDGNFTGSTSPAINQTVRATPIVSLNPLFVSFGNQNVNTTSSGIKITLTNAGDAVLTPITIGLSGAFAGDFIQTNNCPSSLGYTAPNNSCTITVVFAPVDTGALEAALTITSNDDGTSGSQQYVSLAGGGVSTIIGGSLFSNGIFATAFGCNSVNMRGGSTVDSFDSSLGFSSSHTLSGGNVGSNGTVNLSGQNTAIYGAVSVWNQNCSQVPSGFSNNGGGQPTGGLEWLSGPGNYPPPPMPYTPPVSTQTISGSCGSITGCTNTGSRTVSLAPGSYGNINLSGGVTAHVSAGTYNLNSLALSGNSVLYVDSGPVYVNIAGASLNGGNPVLDFSGGTMQNPTLSPANLQFSYSGSQGVNLSGGSSSYATVYAPNAPVNLSGGTDFFGSIIGSIFTNSGGVALHYDRHLAAVKAGDYIWFNAVINNVKGLPAGTNPAQVKLYMTDSTINFTANGTSYSVSVPNAVVTFNSTTALGTSFSNSSSRWSTSIPAADVTGNTFVAGVAFQVPVNFPAGIQNVSWSAAYSTDTSGITLQWQWGAAVYSSFSTTYATTTNSNALGVNPEDGAADPNGKDAAGTPETYKTNVVFGGTGCGSTDYAGHLSYGAGVVPSLAPVSVSPSSLDFGTQPQGVKTTTPMTAILTNNDSASYTISTIAVTGTDAADFAVTNSCPTSPSTLAAGASCTIGVTFTPGDVGTRTAKITITDGASNSPQTVYLTGTGH